MIKRTNTVVPLIGSHRACWEKPNRWERSRENAVTVPRNKICENHLRRIWGTFDSHNNRPRMSSFLDTHGKLFVQTEKSSPFWLRPHRQMRLLSKVLLSACIIFDLSGKYYSRRLRFLGNILYKEQGNQCTKLHTKPNWWSSFRVILKMNESLWISRKTEIT